MASTSRTAILLVREAADPAWLSLMRRAVLYHQPDKMTKSGQDLEERKDNLEKLKKQHGID